jgi:hypothetical protein
MDKTKSQAFNFAYEAIPIMFHTQTKDFFTYLERDGLEFLEFWWNYVGEKVGEKQHRSFEGMDFKFMRTDKDNTIIIITLPAPLSEDEIHYLLLQAKPEKRFAWVKFPNTRVVALIRKASPEDPDGTELGDITPRGIYVRIRKGPTPTFENIEKIAKGLLKTQQK